MNARHVARGIIRAENATPSQGGHRARRGASCHCPISQWLEKRALPRQGARAAERGVGILAAPRVTLQSGPKRLHAEEHLADGVHEARGADITEAGGSGRVPHRIQAGSVVLPTVTAIVGVMAFLGLAPLLYATLVV